MKDESLAAPSWVEIHSLPDGFALVYFDSEGESITDTWHADLEAAKSQASFEFGIEGSEWENREP